MEFWRGIKQDFQLQATEQITVQELQQRIEEGSVDQVVDVRRVGEWNSGHIFESDSYSIEYPGKGSCIQIGS